MDTTDRRINFDSQGVCHHCRQFDYVKKYKLPPLHLRQSLLDAEILKIKREGTGSQYDCVIGLSGGVDSSYLAYLVVKEFGLRPLAIHLDNGWNSLEAVKNINNIIKRLSIDFQTHVIDWEEFKDLQISYFKSSVLDIEVLTDHAISALIYKVAKANNIKHVLMGTNRATEQILPLDWRFNKNDLINLTDIHNKFGKSTIKTFPTMGDKLHQQYEKIDGIESFSPLNFVDYDKNKAKKILIDELRWQDYGGKHYESVFTRFYQGYILPRKFNVDKRKAHFATLINSGIMTREEALLELKKPPYPEDLLKKDYDYVIKKLEMSSEEFEALMLQKPKSHFFYKTDLRSKLNFIIYPAIFPYYKKLMVLKHFLKKKFNSILFQRTQAAPQPTKEIH